MCRSLDTASLRKDLCKYLLYLLKTLHQRVDGPEILSGTQRRGVVVAERSHLAVNDF